ncbi:MAG: PepSY-associated TM helix domain-containing protein [Myxococcota bacterium]
MKLSAPTFRVEWELHAWAGVALSLWAFIVFYCGVFALFRRELAIWQEPALYAASQAPPSFEGVRMALREAALLPEGAYLSMVPYPGTSFVASYVKPTGGATRMTWVDPRQGSIVPERTRLSHELYHLHHLQQLPGGEEASGVAAVFLIVALVTGLVIHLKDLPEQLVRLRLGLRPRFSMSDVHKVLGVFGLPFMTVVAWSGAVFVLGGTYAKGARAVVRDLPPIEALMGDAKLDRAREHVAAATLDLDTLVRRAQAALGDEATPTYLQLFNDGDRAAWMRLYFPGPAFGGERVVFLDAVQGKVIEQATPPYAIIAHALHNFHFARYGGLIALLIHAMLALAGAIVIVTGNIVWVARRDPQRERPVHLYIEAATIGVCCGLVLASALYAAANRLELPFERVVFYGAWLVATAVTLILRPSPRRAITWFLGGAALIFASVVGSDLLFAKPIQAVVVSDFLFTGLALCSAVAAAASTFAFRR